MTLKVKLTPYTLLVYFITLVSTTYFNLKATPIIDDDYTESLLTIGTDYRLKSSYGFILCHIMPLVINILGGRRTYTCMHTHTHIHTYTHIPTSWTKVIRASHAPAVGQHTPDSKISNLHT